VQLYTCAAARALFQAALRYPASYKRVEWWDTREGKLPNPDVQYPQLAKPAAFVCTDRTCSPPMFNPADIQAKADQLLGVTKGVGLIASPAKVVASR
jgi:uncharacterized protein YyaL (SSP411 family)